MPALFFEGGEFGERYFCLSANDIAAARQRYSCLSGMNGGLDISSDELLRALEGVFSNARFVFFEEGDLENDIFACGKNDIGLRPTILPLRGNDIHACRHERRGGTM